MSRFVTNAGAFYSYLAHGLGPTWAVAGAFAALISYNAIQIGLYGLFGSALGDLVEPMTGVSLPWWAWGVAALIIVGLLGMRRVDLNANVLAVLLVLECVAVVLYDIGAFTHPAATGMAVRPRWRRRRCSCRGSARSSRSASPRSSASSPARSTARSQQPAGHGGQGHVRRRRVHGPVLRAVVVGHGRHGRAGRTYRSRRPSTGRASCSRAWPSTGATASP